MVFETRVAGIPCQCLVTHYSPELPMKITGTGYGDAEPPEPEEFEFRNHGQAGLPRSVVGSQANPTRP